jgi:mannose PTS system EIIA component
MTRLVVVAHHPLASALQQVAQHVYPECGATLVCVDIVATDDLESATAKVRQAMNRNGDAIVNDSDQTLCMVDVLGATPGRAARAALPHAQLVTGVNVPMLWRALCYCEEPAEQLCARALDGATRGTARWQDEA